MDDPNLICILRPCSVRAERVFSLEHNQTRYIPPPSEDALVAACSRDATPATVSGSDEKSSSQIRLTFDQKPKNVQQGFVFGSDPNTCDVLLGPSKNRISRQHFRIAFDECERLVIEAISKTRSMVLSYNGQGEQQDRRLFKWILFQGPDIVVTVDKGVHRESIMFDIEQPRHTRCQTEFQNNVRLFLSESRNAIGPLDLLDINSLDSTALPTPKEALKQLAIYIQDEELGRGQFGTVYKSVDVSTGRVYAGKYFNKGAWKREVNIMRQMAHVCP